MSDTPNNLSHDTATLHIGGIEVESNPRGLSLGVQLEELTSDEAFMDELSALHREIQSDDDYALMAETEREMERIDAAIRAEDDITKVNQLADHYEEVRATLRTHDKYAKYEALKDKIYEIEILNSRIIDSKSDQAKDLLGALVAESPIIEVDEGAPFMNFKDNTTEAWQYVPDAAVRDYLMKRPFVDTRSMHLSGNNVRIGKPKDGEPLRVPAALFVSIAGFESWLGRKPNIKKTWSSEYGHQESSSLNTMKHYASLTSELPSVSVVNVYIQPDGKIFANNGAGDSHRIGAAFLRGDKDIKADNIFFTKLNRNYV